VWFAAVLAALMLLAACGGSGDDGWTPPVEQLPSGRSLGWRAVPDPPIPPSGGYELRDATALLLKPAAAGGLDLLAGQERNGTISRWALREGRWTAAETFTGPGARFARLPDGELCGVASAAIAGCSSPDGDRFTRLEVAGLARGAAPYAAWWGVGSDDGRFAALVGAAGERDGARLLTRRGGALRPASSDRGGWTPDELGALLTQRDDGALCRVGAASDALRDNPGPLTDVAIVVACGPERGQTLRARLRFPPAEEAQEKRISPTIRLTSAVIADGRAYIGLRVDWSSEDGSGGTDHATTWVVLAQRENRFVQVPVGGSIGNGRVDGTLALAGGRIWAVRIAEPDGTGPRGRADLLEIDPRTNRAQARGTLASDVETASPAAAGMVAAGRDRLWVAVTVGAGRDAPRPGWRLWSAPLS
jgi:hypothetical protein